ncbi:uncharacterized protein LOC113836632 [Cricetulus griseus]|uniref:Uncharacterized protein LOC113836632 n=1 Tax=Cricetulus griseus TaxID=10029 RepID=A0A9J7H5I9_CRIGR|nr:uncharacterized protein LOC113836632 [Cricetulus griseus]
MVGGEEAAEAPGASTGALLGADRSHLEPQPPCLRDGTGDGGVRCCRDPSPAPPVRSSAATAGGPVCAAHSGGSPASGLGCGVSGGGGSGSGPSREVTIVRGDKGAPGPSASTSARRPPWPGPRAPAPPPALCGDRRLARSAPARELAIARPLAPTLTHNRSRRDLRAPPPVSGPEMLLASPWCCPGRLCRGRVRRHPDKHCDPSHSDTFALTPPTPRASRAHTHTHLLGPRGTM